MKKLITIILILALFLPAAALAADPDPIIGCWYFVVDVNMFPKHKQAQFLNNVHIRDTKMEAYIFWFTEEGEIYQSITKFRTKQSESEGANIVGTWTKLDNGKYNVVLDSQISKTSITDNRMFVKFGNGQYAFRKMETINKNKDWKR